MNTNEGREAKAMEFSAQSVIYLNETRKWTLFFSILGFIFLGLMVIGSLFMMTMFGTLAPGGGAFPGMGIFLGIVYLLVGLLYFFPILYLFKFSKHSRIAIYNEDSEQLELAIKYQKAHYKFIGILTIVILSLYVLFFLFAIITGGLGALM